jgi:hypothetical protein
MSKKKKSDSFTQMGKRMMLGMNVMKGKLGEGMFEAGERMKGHDVKRIHKGGDYVVQKRDFFGRKIGKPKVHEVKTGNARLSKAQRSKRKKLKGGYKVDRY